MCGESFRKMQSSHFFSQNNLKKIKKIIEFMSKYYDSPKKPFSNEDFT